MLARTLGMEAPLCGNRHLDSCQTQAEEMLVKHLPMSKHLYQLNTYCLGLQHGNEAKPLMGLEPTAFWLCRERAMLAPSVTEAVTLLTTQATSQSFHGTHCLE